MTWALHRRPGRTTLRPLFQHILTLCLGVSLSGCGPNYGCPEILSSALTVEVVDDASSQAICDAEIAVLDGALGVHSGMPSTTSGTCYVYFFLDQGSYSLTVSAPGYEPAASQPFDVVEEGACHQPKQQLITVRLARAD